MNLKPILSKAFQAVASSTGVSVWRAKRIAAGRILKFHGVGDDLYSETDFEAHLKFLNQHFSIVKFDELLGKIARRELLKHEIVLTFDDGLRNNFTGAYPVLQRLKIPATFFVCPGLIENSCWLWTHEVRARLQFLDSKKEEFISRWKPDSAWSTEQFVSWMKHLPIRTRDEVEAHLREFSFDFQPTTEQKQKFDLMSWDEIRSLDPALITVGSHTVTHPILPNLQPRELEFEISASRKLLEEKLRRPVEYFCYPNGSHNKAVIEETRKNYRAAVSTEVGFVTPESDFHRLPRIGIAQEIPLLAWRLHRPTA